MNPLRLIGMRSIVFAVAIALAACAGAPKATSKSGHVNVAVIRGEIKNEIAGERAIHSMGKVTPTTAEVYTEAKGQPRHQELWAKGPDGQWKLQESREVTATR